MSDSPVYLDYNATAPLRAGARTAMVAALEITGNASSVHRFGRQARTVIEDARRQVAALADVRPGQVIFTSGGTEANNIALNGVERVLVSAGEHDSVLQARAGAERIPLLPEGRVDLAALETLLEESGKDTLVSVMLANNETGVIQPVKEVVALARAQGARVHCDAVQAPGKLLLSMGELGVDMLTLSAHKLGGPQGVGALVVAEGTALRPQIRGGGQERRRRAGTENLVGIAGFGAASLEALDGLPRAAALAELRDDLERGLRQLDGRVEVFGQSTKRLPNTSCFALTGFAAETLVMALDLASIAVSAGSACSSGKVTPSHVLTAMGASPEAAGGAIRVSLGWQTMASDVDRLLSALAEMMARRGSANQAGAASAA